ncbi:Protein atonal like protein 8 [Melipona quadrifasciata]|uniref:Protein atonal like protein 8 n=1 Tax=Melipona quadrifasciata TaxID=166423 RepID=A0A0M8ZN81_9HYME|nr:Protein atonal like protein 8 [Melipona quadrifasciata]
MESSRAESSGAERSRVEWSGVEWSGVIAKERQLKQGLGLHGLHRWRTYVRGLYDTSTGHTEHTRNDNGWKKKKKRMKRGAEKQRRKMDGTGAAWRDATHRETESNSRPAGAVLSAPAASCGQQSALYTSSPFVSPAIVTNVSANTTTNTARRRHSYPPPPPTPLPLSLMITLLVWDTPYSEMLDPVEWQTEYRSKVTQAKPVGTPSYACEMKVVRTHEESTNLTIFFPDHFHQSKDEESRCKSPTTMQVSFAQLLHKFGTLLGLFFVSVSAMSSSEKDAGFCSGGDEDDMSDLRSPSASEDSLEVQITPISLKNKRKLAEPRRIHEPSTAPLKKRRFQGIEEETMPDEESTRTLLRSPSPFRPWSYTSSKTIDAKHPLPLIATAKEINDCNHENDDDNDNLRQSNSDRSHDSDDGDTLFGKENPLWKKFESQSRESLANGARQSCPQTRALRIENREISCEKLDVATSSCATSTSETILSSTATPSSVAHPRLQEEPLSLVLRGDVTARVPSHPAVNETTAAMITAAVSTSTTTVTMTSVQNSLARQHPTTGQQRNYKNMTRERRIEANARERTRVHTISAAFDTLRRAIPAYSHNQKLSKLSVLRIACSYIMTLGKIVDITDKGEPINGASLGACVDLVSKTIQTEGKLRKRKED